MAQRTKSAINHFDKFYPYIYSIGAWRSIRLGLFCEAKKMFVINNAYSMKQKLIDNLKRNGAIDFLTNLRIEQRQQSSETNEPGGYLQHNFISTEKQLNEFVQSTEYVGSQSIYTKSIDNSFVDYSSQMISGEIAEQYRQKMSEMKADMIDYESVALPEALSVLAYPRAVVRKPFLVPVDDFGQCGFLPIDGFSVLAALMLGVKPRDRVLDMCAAPGGKSVTLLNTGLIDELVCIDNSPRRIERLQCVLKTHYFEEDVKQRVTVVLGNSIDQLKYTREYFDKVLIDAPCSTDRHAVADPSFGIFGQQSGKQRQKLILIQLELLRKAVSTCKVGGDIVYSTCTLSPVQNERIVMSVIEEVNKDNSRFQLKIVSCRSEYYNRSRKANKGVKNKEIKEPTDDWFICADNIDTFGEIVLPNVLNNYGPGFICKLRKVPMSNETDSI